MQHRKTHQNRSGQIAGMQGGTKVNASSWWQTIQRMCRQEEGKDRKEMQKESGMVRCTLLIGSRMYKVFMMSFSECNTK